jgi:hypothetical protein
MWTKIIINFLLVFSAYLFAITLAIAILGLWGKSKEEKTKTISGRMADQRPK